MASSPERFVFIFSGTFFFLDGDPKPVLIFSNNIAGGVFDLSKNGACGGSDGCGSDAHEGVCANAGVECALNGIWGDPFVADGGVPSLGNPSPGIIVADWDNDDGRNLFFLPSDPYPICGDGTGFLSTPIAGLELLDPRVFLAPPVDPATTSSGDGEDEELPTDIENRMFTLDLVWRTVARRCNGFRIGLVLPSWRSVVDTDATLRGNTGGASSSSVAQYSLCANNRGDGSGGNEVLRKDDAKFQLK